MVAECKVRKPIKACFDAKDRETCLMSTDARANYRGKCGWCMEKKCPPPSKWLCEPIKWLQKNGHVEGTIYEECCTKAAKVWAPP